MITIEDHSSPILAAAKIIYGTRPLEEAEKTSLFQTLNIVAAPYEVDMFNIKELREIAAYIYLWCDRHEEDERCSN